MKEIETRLHPGLQELDMETLWPLCVSSYGLFF